MATVSAISSPSQDSKSKEATSFQNDAENGAQEGETTSNPILAENDTDMEDNSNVPKMSLLKLFWFVFYNFGLFAWGGPVAQIALIKERLVIQDKWITLARFQRVFAVYQIIPGPEAAELCMFFGCLSAGRLGGVIAGIAFMLPGFVLMLLASYLYSLAGLENKYFNASFRALQPIVAAMVPLPTAHCSKSANILLKYRQILKATHKIADHSVISHTTKKIDAFLIIAAICTAINGALHINM
jgi:chromate transport protein ChrA